MLPLIIVAGIAGGAAAIYSAKESCNICDSKLTLNENCLLCNEEICGSCSEKVAKEIYEGWEISSGGRCCPEHMEQLLNEIDDLKSAVNNATNVELFSNNYKGKIPDAEKSIILKSNFHTDRADAERELKILASIEGSSFVTDVNIVKETENRGGNYYYSVWQYKGKI